MSRMDERDASDTLAQHVRHLVDTWSDALERNHYAGAWVAAGDATLHFQDDHGPIYKPNPYFTQWVDPQFAQPGALVLIRPAHAQPVVLFTLQPDDYWHAVADTPDYLSPYIDIRGFRDSAELSQAARTEVQGSGQLAYVGASLSNEISGDLNPPDLLNRLDFQRAVKTQYELETMRTASLIGVRGHVAAAECFHNGGTEFEIHMAYLMASGQNEGQLPYGNIVALNEHAATLHYQHQERVHRSAAKSLLIDAGGQYRGYASDITRTYAMHGVEHEPFASLIRAMQEHQDRIIAQINTSLSFADLHAFMHRSLCDVLADQQLITCSAEEAFAKRINEAFCPHGLGHLLGIQVHDVGGHLADPEGTLAPPAENYPSLRFTRQVEPDQVFTIEPGLYFIDSLLDKLRADGAPVNWDAVDALRPYGGVRIEDNVRVLPVGVENMTRDAFILHATQSGAG